MPAICSRVSDSGHAVLVRLPGGARFVGRYADDGSVRDLTPFLREQRLSVFAHQSGR